ncbi:hypothetical protein BBJ29_009503 [Phytophthora kernoviae]|uniref:Uncharacterized protein n=1 Tax=Phytophthora kernoviae TaxID=325452 RepID=A0A3F2RD49_9STRA|nr:hypothetical protein BBP00_00009692 [Phytophthora kernoviae]RLN70825.1 hypothetical protein BBJ29_009503 [Phytophthora kernoviae]
MLSITAASLSRKDIAIAEAEAKVTSMARIIDSLTESNKQLSHRVDQLENLAAAMASSGGAEGEANRSSGDDNVRRPNDADDRNSSGGRRRETNYERIDTLLLQDDERMDRTNRMLLETMFGMARMVETCAIQMSKDMMDSLEYQLDGNILQHLAEMMVHELDVDQRLQNIATFHERVQPSLPQVITSDSIYASSGTENVAFVAMLGTVHKLNMEKQRGDFLNIVTTWRRVRGLLLEVKRMNDNYDSGMVVHLLKEMRTCETLFKQLHSDLAQLAVTSNESSSALSQIAYKALSLTWSCIRARDIHPQAPLGLVDERTHERVREFSRVESSCIRDLLVHDSEIAFNQLNQPAGGRKSSGITHIPVTGSMTPVVPERDVDLATAAVRRVLLAYSKDLSDIFKHYSASGGAGSLAAMSLAEYNKFIKDCFTEDKRITPELAEGVYKVALQSGSLSTGGADATSNMTTEDLNATVEATAGADTGETSEDGPELSGRQFSDSLVRLAAVKYAPAPVPRAPVKGASARAAPIPVLPLDERIHLLMEQDVLPHALRSQRELFRAEVAAPKVREVFQRHKPVLQRVFRYYASMHALREQNSTISLSSFIVMARDCKLVGSFVTEHTLKQALVNLQRDDGDYPSTPGLGTTEAELEMLRADFSDFQEALAALTEYVVCNPYVPLHKRIDQFLQDFVLPRARQKKKSGE